MLKQEDKKGSIERFSETGIVFDIQNYATFDGPGIRTTVFFKGCPLSCVWCHNPESWNPAIERTYLDERCVSCGICTESCKNHAISMTSTGPCHNAERCVACGDCVRACPNDAIEMVGKRMTAENIVTEVLKDKPFYETSGGGVTFSGGEAALQAEFLLACLRACHAQGVHTALETCGLFSPKRVDALCEVVDLFLFDLKHLDAAEHEKLTGTGNELILRNFQAILKKRGETGIIVRIPIVPGVQTLPHTLDGFTDFLQNIGYGGDVHLMPYNRLAKSKWRKTGRAEQYRDFGVLHPDDLAAVRRHFEEAEFHVVVNS